MIRTVMGNKVGGRQRVGDTVVRAVMGNRVSEKRVKREMVNCMSLKNNNYNSMSWTDWRKKG